MYVHFCHFTPELKNQRMTYVVHATFLVNQQIQMHIQHFVSLIWLNYSFFKFIFYMKKCRKVCSLKFAKTDIHIKMMSGIRAKIPRTSLANQENSHTHTTFSFLNFTNVINFFEYKPFMKMCRMGYHFIFSIKVNFAMMAHTTLLH